MSDGPDPLELLVGRWDMTPAFAAGEGTSPFAVTTFEWLEGRRFLIQRWTVDHPDAPDGIAVIGSDPATSCYVQHYFDSRGVARVYDMTLADGTWTLERIAGPPDFSQRFIGRFDDSGQSILGQWDRSDDNGSTWIEDFGLAYRRVV
jgi:hypothetical protein